MAYRELYPLLKLPSQSISLYLWKIPRTIFYPNSWLGQIPPYLKSRQRALSFVSIFPPGRTPPAAHFLPFSPPYHRGSAINLSSLSPYLGLPGPRMEHSYATSHGSPTQVQLTTASWAVVSCFFFQTLISKTASWVKLFFLSSHKDISWMKLEKSSLFSFSLISLSQLCMK